MNPRDLNSASLLLPEDIERARAIARSSGKSVVDALEDQLGLPAEQFVHALGATLGYDVISMGSITLGTKVCGLRS